MHLVSNDSRKEDNSGSEPILSQSNILQHSGEESPSSRETKSSGRDCDVHVAESESTRIDEICHLVNPHRPQCRICLDIGGEDLIAPCDCKGTQKYVHRSCLDNWRSTMVNARFSPANPFPDLHSDVCRTLRPGKIMSALLMFIYNLTLQAFCRAMFILRANVPADRCWLRLKFLFLVARDHTFIFAIFNLIFAFLGFLVFKLSGVELREFTGSEEHFYAIAVLAIVMSSFLCSFLISVECAPRINGRHYHLLLIKEYVSCSVFSVGPAVWCWSGPPEFIHRSIVFMLRSERCCFSKIMVLSVRSISSSAAVFEATSFLSRWKFTAYEKQEGERTIDKAMILMESMVMKKSSIRK
ncbi:RING/FYVE/PHD ZINC FINGER SUPERFAMILY PROTEIN [Salix koriyanagi]|uniref:RING/FYVE/PHD ZINC FINGER SUPERFAMILY PROTEIN n=1 Tax=Salix koriyanagi TaxID=2511006 RepID=A0A9Q0WIP8_9ROSI|nr:RING/FYVE/PHD ZINC FINGER SUPERFAMILY PROTEIN [Salix koriyanagi]